MQYNGLSKANARKRSLSSRKGSSMWWLEPHGKIRQLPRLAIALFVAGLTAGCFQPLYGARTTDGSTVADQLRLVSIEPIRASNGTPEAALATELRNIMIFDLGGGAPASAPTHKLTLQLNILKQQVIVDVTTSRPDVEQAGINATYTLTEIGSGKVVVRGQTFSRVSYDNPGQAQRFASARGRRDAEQRAAKVISENIRARLSSYFVAGT
jgi:LPS-assembly lipoprotein